MTIVTHQPDIAINNWRQWAEMSILRLRSEALVEVDVVKRKWTMQECSIDVGDSALQPMQARAFRITKGSLLIYTWVLLCNSHHYRWLSLSVLVDWSWDFSSLSLIITLSVSRLVMRILKWRKHSSVLLIGRRTSMQTAMSRAFELQKLRPEACYIHILLLIYL